MKGDRSYWERESILLLTNIQETTDPLILPWNNSCSMCPQQTVPVPPEWEALIVWGQIIKLKSLIMQFKAEELSSFSSVFFCKATVLLLWSCQPVFNLKETFFVWWGTHRGWRVGGRTAWNPAPGDVWDAKWRVQGTNRVKLYSDAERVRELQSKARGAAFWGHKSLRCMTGKVALLF